MGRTTIRQLDDGTSYRAKILRKIQDHNAKNHNKIKFLVGLGDHDFEKIISYNTLCDLVEDQHVETVPEEKVWVFTSDTKALSRGKIQPTMDLAAKRFKGL
jgi:hypothetical protein